MDVTNLGTTSTFNNIAKVCYKKEQFWILSTTGGIFILIYAICFVIGLRNIYSILFKQRLYKSIYLSLQYVFGQLVLVCRLIAYSLFAVWMFHIYRNYCVNGSDSQQLYLEIFFQNIQFIQGLMILVLMSMTCKLCLGAVTIAMLISAYFKI